jgi:CRP-like cAMP-binding protein
VLSVAGQKIIAKGDTICRRGEPGDSLMVLLSGRVKVVNTTTDAKEVVLNVLGPGDLNGEIGALDGKGRTADAIALEACEIFTVNARDLLQTLAAHPAALLRTRFFQRPAAAASATRSPR